MAMSLNELTSSLVTDTYTPRTDEELQTAAQNRYASVYNQKRLTANQNYQTTDLAYQNQMNQLADSLAYSQQQIQKNTNDSIAAANRNMITRGMQRSSYSAANEARIASAGTMNLANLLREYNTNANNIQSNRTLLARQLADTLASYDIDMQNDILSYIDEQKQLDYERQLAATQYKNSILMDLYQFGQAARSGGGGGSRKKSSGGGGNKTSIDLNDLYIPKSNSGSGLFNTIYGNSGGDVHIIGSGSYPSPSAAKGTTTLVKTKPKVTATLTALH